MNHKGIANKSPKDIDIRLILLYYLDKNSRIYSPYIRQFPSDSLYHSQIFLSLSKTAHHVGGFLS